MSNKATETALNDLHGVVAKVLADQLKDTITIEDEETGEQKELFTASPATLAQAIKFLKDNDITSSIEDDANMSELEELLKSKREKRGLRLATASGEAIS